MCMQSKHLESIWKEKDVKDQPKEGPADDRGNIYISYMCLYDKAHKKAQHACLVSAFR